MQVNEVTWHKHNDLVPQDLKELKQVLLQNRHIAPDQEQNFLHPKLPFDLTNKEVGFDSDQLERSIKLVFEAVSQGWPVLVFGDYDADGITATAIVWRLLRQLGADVKPFIPDRERHGYGLSDTALDEILASQQPPRLVITVDNGIVAHQQVKRLKELDISVIITDHHQPESELPPADAIVHSTLLCGATVGWMWLKVLLSDADPAAQQALKKLLQEQLDLTAVATIADQMPLGLGPSRSFAVHGLAALQHSSRPGLLALLTQADVAQSEISAHTINYILAPRINAMGRLDDAMDALRLLCTSSHAKAQELARLLGSTNHDRQQLTQELLQLAESQIDQTEDARLIVVASDQFHEGVIGLIAGRLTEKFSKPAIVLAIKPNFAKASARSVPGVNVVELIRTTQEHLLAVGGHPMAAGFSVALEKLELVTQLLQTQAQLQISASQLQPTLEIDCRLPIQLLEPSLMDTIAELAPFGKHNPAPVFELQQLQLLEVRQLGRMAQHLKLILQDKDANRTFEGLWWGQGKRFAEFTPGKLLDVAGTPSLNEWKGRQRVQLSLSGVRSLD